MGLMDYVRPPREPGTISEPTAPRVTTPRPMTAAGERIHLTNPDEAAQLRNRVYHDWQNDAWAYYDAIAEISYGFDLVAAVMSRIRLYPAFNIDSDGVPISTVNYLRRKIDQSKGEQEKDIAGELTLPPAITEEVIDYLEDLVAELFSGQGGQSSLLRSYALNMCVAGECYLINHKNKWAIRSTDEVVATGDDRFLLRRLRAGGTAGTTTAAGGQPGDVELPKGAYVGRIWREHPRYSLEPTSSMLSLREMCDELLTLQRMIRVVARSRMNAGILYVPDGLVVSGSSINEETESDEEALDEIISDIYDTVTAPIEDETNAATVFPTIVTGPKDASQAMRLISLARESDQFLVERCDRTLERILQGLDMPKDVVSGMANVKYSNAIQIDESLYKGHIEPLALMLVDALTTMYIHPALKKQFKLTQRELDFLRIWYDPSEVVTKSDPATSANTGYDNFAISAAAWRNSHGFSDTDAPSEHELAQRYLFLKGAPQPEQLSVLMKEAFPTITDKQRAANIANSPVPMPESAQNLLFGEVVAPVDQTTRDAANPSVSASEAATSVNPGNPTSGRATGTYDMPTRYGG
ncbi:portal protein [Gordonia phage Sixama]|uniref:Portal protein n=1 Tax=Gordonia phage Sixama TaxID=2653271 RepID=A0A5Q2F1W7_9CAUD|nr:portal protein [Gordonia phage Sixama]QGF20251.1 portal protein [Gordonia phage Sixama]